MFIFHFCDYDSYRFKISRSRFNIIDCIGQTTDIIVAQCGYNWPEWENDKCIYDNILRLYQCEPNIIIGYLHRDIPEYVMCDFAKTPILKALTFHELREGAKKVLSIARPDIVIHAYPHERDMGILPTAQWYCIPHCISSNVFNCYTPFQNRNIDFAACGISNNSIYPLRHTIVDTICELSDTFNCYIHPHPGNKVINANSDQHLIDLSKILNQSKIVCICSSKYKYCINKFTEISACGSVICSDMPVVNEYKNELQKCMICVPSNINTYELKNILINELHNTISLLEKHNCAVKYSQHYTLQKYSNRLIDIIKENI